MAVYPIEFTSQNDLVLRGFVHKPQQYDTGIVFLHGFPGNNDYPVSVRIGPSLERRGYLVLRFAFSGTAPSDGSFEDKLMSREVKDVKYALDFIEKNYSCRKMVLVGHSTGAIDAALYAFQDNRLDGLVLLGGVGRLSEGVRYDFNEKQERDFLAKGYIVYDREGKWTHGKQLKRAFYDEFFTLDVLGSLHKFNKPVLIVHGEKDEDVPVEKDPLELYAAANEPKKLMIIKDADHKFLDEQHWNQMIDEIDLFVKSAIK